MRASGSQTDLQIASAEGARSEPQASEAVVDPGYARIRTHSYRGLKLHSPPGNQSAVPTIKERSTERPNSGK